jgi:hypothetical protein
MSNIVKKMYQHFRICAFADRCGNRSDSSLSEKLGIVSEKLGVLERTGGELLRQPSQDMLDDLHVIDTASIIDKPRVFNAKTRFGPKVDPLISFASSVGSMMALSSSVGSITPCFAYYSKDKSN